MKQSIFYTLISFVLLLSSFNAEEKKNHHVGFKLALGDFNTRDKLVSPLLYSGLNLPLQLIYRYYGTVNRHTVRFSFVSGEISSKTNNNADLTGGGFEYSFHRYITSLYENEIKLFIGGVWNTRISARKHYFYSSNFPTYNDSETGELISSFGLSSLIEYLHTPENRFIIQMSLPLAAYIVRPDYSLLWDDVSSGDLVSFNQFFQFNFSFKYGVEVSSYFNLEWNYSFTYYTISFPFEIDTIVNKFGMEVIFKL